MFEYNEILPKKYIVYQNEPYEVIEAHIARTQMRKPQNQTKLRNLITGRVIPATFHASDKAEEANIETRDIKYLYSNRGQYWFCEQDDPSKRFELKEGVVGDLGTFTKTNSLVTAIVFDDTIIGVRLPVKVDLKVTEAPPAVKGNTAQGATKQITLETGAVITAPLFINEGDIIRINTDTGEYTERVEKGSQ